jgi:hypothetical protein
MPQAKWARGSRHNPARILATARPMVRLETPSSVAHSTWLLPVHTENLVRVEFVDVVRSHCYTLLSPCATQSFFCLPSFVPGFKVVCSFRQRSSPCATRS